MDGLPLSKSSSRKMWPILGKLCHTLNDPFTIGLYCGSTDPQDVNEYLEELGNELSVLFEEGFEFEGVRYQVIIRNYILDAPARSLVKCCIGHGGFSSCEKCCVAGEEVEGRLAFTALDEPLRTDESFFNQDDRLHHSGVSPLVNIGTGMVSQFRFDPFHLVWHGVLRRLFMVWNKWNGPWRLDWRQKREISNAFLAVTVSCPSDFNRKPREFQQWSLYKGTEKRRIGLYDGILAFKRTLDDNIYKQFLLLHAAMRILASPIHVQSRDMCAYADRLLREFINHCALTYGDHFVVYNVHSLAHLSQECMDHGTVDEFSAFPFENALKTLKSCLRSGFKPLQQAALRDLERNGSVELKFKPDQVAVKLSGRHRIPENLINGSQFKCLTVGDGVIKINTSDSCVRTRNGNIMVTQNIIRRNNEIFLTGKTFRTTADYYDYDYPLP